MFSWQKVTKWDPLSQGLEDIWTTPPCTLTTAYSVAYCFHIFVTLGKRGTNRNPDTFTLLKKSLQADPSSWYWDTCSSTLCCCLDKDIYIQKGAVRGTVAVGGRTMLEKQTSQRISGGNPGTLERLSLGISLKFRCSTATSFEAGLPH